MEPDREAQLADLKQCHPDWGRDRLSKLTGIPGATVQRWLKRQVSQSHNIPDGYKLKGTSTLYDAAGNVKQQWVKTNEETENRQTAIEALGDVIATLKPHKEINFKHKTGELIYIPTLFDHHFGKLCWGEETGNDYDIKIADDLWDMATAFGVSQAKMFNNIGKILLPVGSDLFHINDAKQETGKGTKQDVDGRLAKIYRVAYRAVIRQVEAFAKIAPVEVVPVRGNHDPEMMLTVMELLSAWFKDSKHINVSTSLKRRSAHVWGDCFIGFCHGDDVSADKLPMVFSTEFPEMWGKAKHRTLLVGHWHKKKEMRYTTADTYGNCVVHVCPSLSGTDDWHYSKGFIGDKVTESHLFSKRGKLATFEITASELMA